MHELPWATVLKDDRELVPLGHLVEIRGEKNDPIVTDQILSLTADRGVILYEDKGDVGNRASEDVTRYSVVHEGDLVINSMNVIIGSVGLSKYFGCLSPVYFVLKPIDEKIINMKYLAYHFQIRTFQQSLVRLGYGILDHRMRIPWINLKKELIVLPDLKKQIEIADFLDEEMININQMVALRRRQIELDLDYKSALLISRITGVDLGDDESNGQ
jgi:type I restriction enzyme S subunit